MQDIQLQIFCTIQRIINDKSPELCKYINKKMKDMEFYDVINERRSIRPFQNKQIPQEVLERILNAGLKTPAGYYLPTIICLGYSIEHPEVPAQVKATIENRVHWNKW